MSTTIVGSRPAQGIASAAFAALLLSGCAGSGLELPLPTATANVTEAADRIETGSLPPVQSTETSETTPAKQPPAIAEARRQRANGNKIAAMKTLESAALKAPADKDIARERGMLALETGRIDEARRLLADADDPKAPDWRVKSALGAALAASGDHKDAEREFEAALKLAPDHPSILNNMALSYALAGRHADAERMLRRAAAAHPTNDQTGQSDRARQNLALLLGLNGNLDESRRLNENALPKDVAAANLSYLERLRTASSKVSRAEKPQSGDASETTVGALDRNN